jgi:regulator of RNase E activity RraA
MGDFLDDVQPGQVVVIDNSGREYCTVWGDLMSIAASKKGIAGTLIDGVMPRCSNCKTAWI